jgi:hypothetical protein
MGGVTMIWESEYTMYAQRVDADGIVQWSPSEGIAVSRCSSGSNPVFAPINDYEGYVIVYRTSKDSLDGSTSRIYGCFFDQNGNS